MLVVSNNNRVMFDHAIQALDIGRNSALYELNAPGSVQLKENPGKWNRGRIPYASEIQFDDAYVDMVYLCDVTSKGKKRSRLPLEKTRLYIRALDDDGNLITSVDEETGEKVEGIRNPNAYLMNADAYALMQRDFLGLKDFEINRAVTHFAVPQDHAKDWLFAGFACQAGGNSDQTTKLWLDAMTGYRILNAFFSGERKERCRKPKTIATPFVDAPVQTPAETGLLSSAAG